MSFNLENIFRKKAKCLVYIASLLLILPLAPLKAQTVQGITFFTGTWDDLQTEAKKKDKPYFVDFWATWCGPCVMLNKTTFKDSAVGAYANTYFIPYKLDVDGEMGKQVAQKYNISSIPTIIFFSPTGKVIGRFSGYKNAEQFLEEMKKHSGAKASRHTEQGKNNKDEKQVTFEDYRVLKQKSLEKVEAELFTDTSFKAQNQKAFYFGQLKDDLQFEDQLIHFSKTDLKEKEWYLKAQFALGAKRYTKFIEIINPLAEQKKLNENETYWAVLKILHAPNQELKEIPHEPMRWINNLIRQNPNSYEYLSTKAGLLLKDNKIEDTVEVCKQANKLAQKEGINNRETDILSQLAK